MKIKDIVQAVDAKVLVGEERMGGEVGAGFASDLMSDVLTLNANNIMLITGLCNLQTIRTSEMADIGVILFVRNKVPDSEMLELAEDNDMIVLQTKFSMFKTIGLLFKKGLKPVY